MSHLKGCQVNSFLWLLVNHYILFKKKRKEEACMRCGHLEMCSLFCIKGFLLVSWCFLSVPLFRANTQKSILYNSFQWFFKKLIFECWRVIHLIWVFKLMITEFLSNFMTYLQIETQLFLSKTVGALISWWAITFTTLDNKFPAAPLIIIFADFRSTFIQHW